MCIANLKEREDGHIQVFLNLAIHQDLTWVVHIEGHKLLQHQGLLLSLPQSIQSVDDVVTIVELLNSSASMMCCGNSDEKFTSLIGARKGSFMDVCGKDSNFSYR